MLPRVFSLFPFIPWFCPTWGSSAIRDGRAAEWGQGWINRTYIDWERRNCSLLAFPGLVTWATSLPVSPCRVSNSTVSNATQKFCGYFFLLIPVWWKKKKKRHPVWWHCCWWNDNHSRHWHSTALRSWIASIGFPWLLVWGTGGSISKWAMSGFESEKMVSSSS